MKKFVATKDGQDLEFKIQELSDSQIKIICGDESVVLDLKKMDDFGYEVQADGKLYTVDHCKQGDEFQVFVDGDDVRFSLKDELHLRRDQASSMMSGGSGDIVSPMPGKVLDVKVKAGDLVSVGQGVVVVEAMKMQNELKSQIDGVVKAIKVVPGDSVEGNTLLIEIQVA